MKVDPAEIEDDRELAPAIPLMEPETVTGAVPVEVLLEHLEHVVAMNSDLRLMLKEARYEIRQLRGEVNNLHTHVRGTEESARLLQFTSEARHAEIERLGELLTRAQAELRALQQNPIVRGLRRYHDARRVLGRLRG